MRRLAVALSILALIACGETETGQTGEDQAASSVAAGGEEAAVPETQEPMATPEPMAPAEVDPQVASCLDLIGQAKFQQALPVCLAALSIDPDNEEVQKAVQRARAETAKMPGTGEAAEAASGAAEQADEAAKGLSGKLGQ